jgi:RNA polymerase sigma-70 factor (ECF subfamily)
LCERAGIVTPTQPPAPPNDESELQTVIVQARAGDVDAFNVLVERFQRAAFIVALRMLGDRDLAQDVTQDAVLSAFRHIKQFRGGSFRVWLLRIVTNQCLDYWRAQQRRPSVSLDVILTPGMEDSGADAARNDAALIDPAWDPTVLAERHELQAFIERALLALPEDQRLAVILCDVEGLSYDEIADVTRTNVGTVKSRLARGRARLRDLLLRHPELLPRVYRPDLRGDQPRTPR